MFVDTKKILNALEQEKFVIVSDILNIIKRYNSAQVYNQKAFSEFKGKFSDRNIVIVAAGPSANKFIPIKTAYI